MLAADASLPATAAARCLRSPERFRGGPTFLPAPSEIGAITPSDRAVSDDKSETHNSRLQRIFSALTLQIEDGEIVAINSVVNPQKLGHLGAVGDLGELLRSGVAPPDTAGTNH